MTDLQCPAVLLLGEDPRAVLEGRVLGPVGPGAEIVCLPQGEDPLRRAAAEDALVDELVDTRRGESVVLEAEPARLRELLRRHGCTPELPARIEADSGGWRRTEPAGQPAQERQDPEPAAVEQPSADQPSAERHVALPLAEMTGLQMHAITLLRERVFVVEQKTTEVTEIDELDALQTTVHHWLEIDGRPAAVLRVLAHEEAIAIGRVATAHGHRGKGLAGRLMRLVLQDLAPLNRPVVLLGQSHLEQWYERLGFVRSGNEVLEVGIPHVPMTLSR